MRPFFPPRPGITIYWPLLGQYEGKGWVAQRKFNGQRNLVYISSDRKVEVWSRHEEKGFEHLNYILSPEQHGWLVSLNIPDGKEVVLDSELLHTKTKGKGGSSVPKIWRSGCKDTIVLFDVLYLGQYLSFRSQSDRLEMLREICGNPTELEPGGRALVVRDRLWMAESFESGFLDRFNDMLDCPEIEGVVLRNKTSTLIQDNRGCGRQRHEVQWMIRARKENGKYHH